MTFRAKLLMTVAAAIGLTLGPRGAVHSQDTEPPAPEEELTKAPPAAPQREEGASMRHVKRRATMPPGEVQLFLPLQISLSAGEVGKPIFVAPNVSIGVNQKWTIHVLHSEAYRAPDAVAGICFTGKDNGCRNVYNNATLDTVASLIQDESFSLTASGGISMVQSKPFLIGAVLGSAAEWSVTGAISFQVEPALLLAFNKSDVNPHRFSLTSRAFLQASKPLLLFIVAGLFSPFKDFSTEHGVPVGAGFLYGCGPNLDLGLQFTFTDLLGAKASADDRQLTVLAAIRR